LPDRPARSVRRGARREAPDERLEGVQAARVLGQVGAPELSEGVAGAVHGALGLEEVAVQQLGLLGREGE